MLDPEVQQRLAESAARKADNIARTLRATHGSVPVVWTWMAMHLFQIVIVLAGKEFFDNAVHWLFQRLSQDVNVCPFCFEREYIKDKGMCQQCWDQLEEEDREVERQIDLAETPPRGGIS